MLRPSILIAMNIAMFVAAPSIADEGDIGDLCSQAFSELTVFDTHESADAKLSNQYNYFFQRARNHRFSPSLHFATYDKWNTSGNYRAKPKEGDIEVTFRDTAKQSVTKGVQEDRTRGSYKTKDHRKISLSTYLEIPYLAVTSEWPAKHAGLAEYVEAKLATICDLTRDNVPAPRHGAGNWAARIKEGAIRRDCNKSNSADGRYISAYLEAQEATQRSDKEIFFCKYKLSIWSGKDEPLSILTEEIEGYSEIQVSANEQPDAAATVPPTPTPTRRARNRQ